MLARLGALRHGTWRSRRLSLTTRAVGCCIDTDAAVLRTCDPQEVQ